MHSPPNQFRSGFEPLESRHLLSATIIEVTTTADVLDNHDEFVSLREAILAANASPEDNEIKLPAGLYILTLAGAGEDAGLSGDLDIVNSGSLRLVGASRETTTIDAAGMFNESAGHGDRVFDVLPGAVLEITGVTLTGGATPTTGDDLANQSGGAVRVASANLTLWESNVVGNRATRGGGVAIDTASTAFLEAADVTDNEASDGGAVYNAGEMSIKSVTIASNSSNHGAGIYNTGSLGLVSATIVENAAEGDGAGVYSSGSVNIWTTVIDFNVAQGKGGAVVNQGTMSIGASRANENIAGSHGGAVVNQASLEVTDVLFRGNHSTASGGAIYNDLSASLSLTRAYANLNSAVGDGGAIRSEAGATLTIVSAEIMKNSAGGVGGGISADSLNVSQSTITGNSALAGGGIAAGGAFLLDVSTVSGNQSQQQGGGLLLSGAARLITSTISGNQAGDKGGAIHSSAQLVLLFCTVAQNHATGEQAGGGIYLLPAVPNANLSLDHTIVAGNYGGTQNAVLDDDISRAAIPAFVRGRYSLIGNPATAGGLIHGANGNILGDGLGGVLDIHSVLDTRLEYEGGWKTHSLVAGSPAINAGDPDFDWNDHDPPLFFDQRSIFRVQEGRVDIGAFESQADPLPVDGLIHVTANADTITLDGAWSLREAILWANADPGDNVIQLDPGFFGPGSWGPNEDEGRTGDYDIAHNGRLRIVGVGIDQTFIEGYGAIDSELGYGDRLFDIMPGALVEFEGITFGGGYLHLAPSSISGEGGAVRNAGRVAVSDSAFRGNTSTAGGAIANLSSGSLYVANSSFEYNVATNGGAILNYPGGKVFVESSRFTGNRAEQGSGAALYNQGAATILRSEFRSNLANFDGGAIVNQGSQLVLDSSTLCQNLAARSGGAVYSDSETRIVNSTISGNTAYLDGGGVYSTALEAVTNLTLDSSSLVWNRAGQDHYDAVGGGLALGGASLARISNSIIAGNVRGPYWFERHDDIDTASSSLDPDSRFNLVGDPNSASGLIDGVNGNIVGNGLGGVLDIGTVLDVNLADNGGPTSTHALLPNSRAVDSGDPNFDSPVIPYDQRGAGYARVTGGRLDIGAFEFGSDFQNVVSGRHVFYNNSSYDGQNIEIDPFEVFAIDPTKHALLPDGSLADASNVTSYSRGINGIMVDLAGSHPDISADDFILRVGATNDPASWAAAPAPSAIQVLAGQGAGGADRVVITWLDGAIMNTYLQVIVAANADTGLVEEDVFFFGNRVGDSFSTQPPTSFLTSAADELAARFTTNSQDLDVDNTFDFDKSGTITAADMLIARTNAGFLPRIQFSAQPLARPLATREANAIASALQLSPRQEVAAVVVPRLEAATKPALVQPRAVDQALMLLANDPLDLLIDFNGDKRSAQHLNASPGYRTLDRSWWA